MVLIRAKRGLLLPVLLVALLLPMHHSISLSSRYFNAIARLFSECYLLHPTLRLRLEQILPRRLPAVVRHTPVESMAAMARTTHFTTYSFASKAARQASSYLRSA